MVASAVSVGELRRGMVVEEYFVPNYGNPTPDVGHIVGFSRNDSGDLMLEVNFSKEILRRSILPCQVLVYVDD